ncbi:MAG: phosphatase PAP2 family protein [Bdellovibrionota bacterium]
MKSQIPPLRLRRRDFVLTILPLLLWWLSSTAIRTWVISPHCVSAPTSCTAEHVLGIDRYSLGFENMAADDASHVIQLAAATLAVLIPVGFEIVSLPWASVLAAVGTDLVVLAQVAFWNGVGVELSHLLIQRPRPFVYKDPGNLGRDPSHYTSFYSGHTSFVTAMMLGILLVLFARGARRRVLIPLAATAQVMVIATAYFRILAGRHFLTDTLVASVAGGLVAWVVVRSHLTRGKRSA